MKTSCFYRRSPNRGRGSRVRAAFLLLFLCTASSLVVHAQESGGGSATARGPEESKQSPSQPTNRGGQSSPDIVTDNLGRVAASAAQILDFLNRDAGLIVEFKRLLAQDAGAAGQLPDETDLTDAAVTERLNEDLRARVLATRLLRRYGYLLPKLNPDSDLGAEHTLVLQDRAYAIAHATERNEHGPEWLFRLLREPGWLWRRYLIYGTEFVALVLLESLGLKKFH